MSSRVLRKIQPFHGPLTPPAGATPAGATVKGVPLFKLTRQMGRGKLRKDQDGNDVWKKNVHGEPIVRLREPELYEEHLLFYLESQGNGHVEMVQYRPPTPEEEAALIRNNRISEMVPALAAALVDGGLTPDRLADWVRGGLSPSEASQAQRRVAADSDGGTDGPKTASPPQPRADNTDYPKMHGPGRWFLSAVHEERARAGEAEMFQGKKVEAEAASAEYIAEEAEARLTAAAMPEL